MTKETDEMLALADELDASARLSQPDGQTVVTVDQLQYAAKMLRAAARPTPDHIADAGNMVPDAGLVEREAIANIIAPRDSYGRREKHVAAKVDAILALLSTRTVAGEPVAWRSRHSKGHGPWKYEDFKKPDGPSIHLFEVQPLYTDPAPSGRGPATIEACRRLVRHWGPMSYEQQKLLDDIEAAIVALAAPVLTDWQQDKAETSVLPLNRT